MNEKTLPFDLDFIKKITKEYPAPFIIYDKRGILENAQQLYDAFSWVKGQD
jgi:diaminopimelate decarboxylase